MTIFLTGATGYIGGAVGDCLLRDGHAVTALTRSESKRSALGALGYSVVVADLADVAPFADVLRDADAVVNCADADDPYFVATVLDALSGTGKTFVHTSGSSIVGDRAAGEPSVRKRRGKTGRVLNAHLDAHGEVSLACPSRRGRRRTSCCAPPL